MALDFASIATSSLPLWNIHFVAVTIRVKIQVRQFAISLLAIAGLHMRQIMGYTFVIFLLTLFLFGGGLLLWGAG